MPDFVKNPAFEQEMEAESGTVAFLEATTVRVAETATGLAPEQTGYYKRRIKAHGLRVVAEDAFWHLVEFGSANNIPYSPLRRAVEVAGLRLDRTPKK